ncbi:lipoate--protein ligase [Propionigenium maris DSM 9537]|uniref:lipoate--protein ligase n=2 Tax=Propionigenium TaxID=2332 RepID=A0A9W6LPW7_9FUSO|nr:lipoate--protein ligase [Propionigenium maris DSM 9537]
MNKMNPKLVVSNSHDPWFNLAYEEFLLKELREDEIILYLWQNDHTVVIGRNQNPWKECRRRDLEGNGGKVARRLSGGGAVYHDLGNLNFTFLMKRENYDFDRQVEVILKAVQSLGIAATFTGRNDLVVEGKKFSGNAFFFSEEKAYHHGTILIDTDFSRLQDYLTVSKGKMKSKGIESVRSRVVNLSEITGRNDIGIYRHALIDQFEKEYGEVQEIVETDGITMDTDMKSLYEKYSQWNWRYGDSPEWQLQLEHQFQWGRVDIGIEVDRGRIEDIILYTDAMDTNLSVNIREILLHIEIRTVEEVLAMRLHEYNVSNEEKEVYEWLIDEVMKNL